MSTPRHALKIFLSNKFCYAQIVSMDGRVVASSRNSRQSRLSSDSPSSSSTRAATSTSDKVAAADVGSEVARRALELGVDVVRWDRGRQRYHGKVAALITAMQADGVVLR